MVTGYSARAGGGEQGGAWEQGSRGAGRRRSGGEETQSKTFPSNYTGYTSQLFAKYMHARLHSRPIFFTFYLLAFTGGVFLATRPNVGVTIR